MKVNLLGNRSYKDLNQYPVFPWLVKDNKIYENEENIENNKTINNKINNIKKSNIIINEKEDYLSIIKSIMQSSSFKYSNGIIITFRKRKK